MIDDVLDIIGVIVTLKGKITQIVNRVEDKEKREEFWRLCDEAIESGNLDAVRHKLYF